MLLSANKLVVEITIGFVLSLLLKQNEEKKNECGCRKRNPHLCCQGRPTRVLRIQHETNGPLTAHCRIGTQRIPCCLISEGTGFAVRLLLHIIRDSDMIRTTNQTCICAFHTDAYCQSTRVLEGKFFTSSHPTCLLSSLDCSFSLSFSL